MQSSVTVTSEIIDSIYLRRPSMELVSLECLLKFTQKKFDVLMRSFGVKVTGSRR